jgi:hypothetical protein
MKAKFSTTFMKHSHYRPTPSTIFAQCPFEKLLVAQEVSGLLLSHASILVYTDPCSNLNQDPYKRLRFVKKNFSSASL